VKEENDEGKEPAVTNLLPLTSVLNDRPNTFAVDKRIPTSILRVRAAPNLPWSLVFHGTLADNPDSPQWSTPKLTPPPPLTQHGDLLLERRIISDGW